MTDGGAGCGDRQACGRLVGALAAEHLPPLADTGRPAGTGYGIDHENQIPDARAACSTRPTITAG